MNKGKGRESSWPARDAPWPPRDSPSKSTSTRDSRSRAWSPKKDGRPGSRGQSQRRQHEGSRKPWASPQRMASAKAQVNDKRLVAEVAGKGDYSDEPPADLDLIRARVVLPPNWLIYPSGLELPETLNDIRERYQVWIVSLESTQAFDIYSDSISRLHDAVTAFNQLIHDLRLRKELLAEVLTVQHCSRANKDTRISLKLMSRPEVTTPLVGRHDIPAISAALLESLRPHLINATECLMSLSSNIRMRVNFGILKAVLRKKEIPEILTYDEFVEAAKTYSVRGGIGLHDRFSEIKLSNHIIKHLLALDGDGGIRLVKDTVRRAYSLTLRLNQLDQKEIWLQDWTGDGEVALPRAKTGIATPTSYLNWVMAAPDMRIDWGLRADEYIVASVPEEFHGLIKELKLKPAKYKENGNFLRPGEVIFPRPGAWKDRIQQTRLKTSFIAEIHDTPYLLEISITQIWDKYKTKARPRTVWGMEIYGKHWDSAMNHVDPISRRKDWGEAQRNVWVGKDPNMWKRFQTFLEVVLHVQKHVEDIPPLTEEDLEHTESEAEE
ncbi:hypothetical protein V8C26DRAFT_414436 [Trichoderma gracile]